MTNTPKTSRDIVKCVKQPKPYWEINKSYTSNQMFDYALECVQASQAQQAQSIAELVEALEFYANCNYATTHPDGSVELIDYGCTAEKALAKVKGK